MELTTTYNEDKRFTTPAKVNVSFSPFPKFGVYLHRPLNPN